MEKILQIVVSSEFALFKKNDSNEFAMTYDFPPKTQLLGLFGAIIGLTGYSKGEPKAEFYEKLKNLKVAIQPLEKNNESLTAPSKKTIITYNNYHGYGSNEKGGILQVKEQLLIDPRFRIFIKGEGEHYDKLKKMFESQEYFYTPYLGKNEFLAAVEYEGEKDCKKINNKQVKLKSIFLREYATNSIITRGGGNNAPKFLIAEDYPTSFDESYLYKKKTAIYSDGTQEPNYDKIEKDGFEICEVEGKQLFFI